jgi:hypothetical protein
LSFFFSPCLPLFSSPKTFKNYKTNKNENAKLVELKPGRQLLSLGRALRSLRFRRRASPRSRIPAGLKRQPKLNRLKVDQQPT